MNEPEWQRLLADPPARVDPGFTLRVLTALPPVRTRSEQLRARILLLAALVAALLLSIAVLPALVTPSGWLVPMLSCLIGATLAFWTVLTVAD